MPPLVPPAFWARQQQSREIYFSFSFVFLFLKISSTTGKPPPSKVASVLTFHADDSSEVKRIIMKMVRMIMMMTMTMMATNRNSDYRSRSFPFAHL